MTDKPTPGAVPADPPQQSLERTPTVERTPVSRFVANLTHELKTPLHSILALANVLASEVDGPLTDEQRRQVEMITKNGEHLLELIVDLLQFSSAEAGSYRPQLRQFSVKQFFEEIVQSVVPVAQQKGVTFQSDLARLSGMFCSDVLLIRRIVGNLLGNALKFSPSGESVWLIAELRTDGCLHLEIADSGIGMAPHVQRAIFTEFYQVDSGDSRQFGGVGLGLALVKASLTLLGGTIEVRSEEARGSIFLVDIPPGSLPERRVLVVDSDPGVRLSLEEAFRGEGYTSRHAAAGEAFRAMAEWHPDLVMLDLNEPQFEAFALLEQLRSSSWGQDVPVILMSAFDGAPERSRGFELGANDFIVKPFTLSELLARVRTQLERRW